LSSGFGKYATLNAAIVASNDSLFSVGNVAYQSKAADFKSNGKTVTFSLSVRALYVKYNSVCFMNDLLSSTDVPENGVGQMSPSKITGLLRPRSDDKSLCAIRCLSGLMSAIYVGCFNTLSATERCVRCGLDVRGAIIGFSAMLSMSGDV